MTRIGNPDSRYTYCPDQFEKDIADKMQEHERFKQVLRKMILINPSKIDLRYRDAIEVLRELKEEFKL